MAITLTSRYLAELKKGANRPNVVLELALDSGTVKIGYHDGRDITSSIDYLADGTWYADGSIYASGSSAYMALGFSDIIPVLKSVSTLQNKLDTKAGYSTRGQITAVISGRDNFKSMVANNYLKNRRVTRKDGFITPDFLYSDYASTFTGTIQDWSRKGDELTLTISDDMTDATVKIPTENATKTQYLDYRNTNPVDIMTNVLSTQLGIAAGYINSTQFTFERDTWLQSWKFDRVITEPASADTYLNELQIETNSFIVHEGDKISYKVFAPAVPGQTIEEWTDALNILNGSMSVKSGYKDNFYNRVVVYYDFDESGGDKTDAFESAVIAFDSASQGSGQWDEISTKTVKSKWIRSRTYTQTSNIGGLKVYHVSTANGTGNGTLTYTYATNQLTYAGPASSAGEAVTLTKDGKYQVFSADKTKYVRVIITTASLPVINASDTVTITTLNGEAYATTLATKILSRYRDPISSISFAVDLNNVAWNSTFIKPTDLKTITSDEAFEYGETGWNQEQVMLTGVQIDFEHAQVKVDAIETKMYRVYGFIAPAGQPDYGTATAAQKERAYIGRASDNKVGAGSVAGYYVW